MDINEKRRFFGLTFKKSTWNNIIVYVVLIIVATFWFAFPNPNTKISSGPTQSLVGKSDELTGIEFAGSKYQLKEQQWTCQGDCIQSQEQVLALINQWLQLAISATSQRPQGDPVIVTLYFGNDNYAEVELYDKPTVMLRLPQQGQLYLIENATRASLIPSN